MPNADARQRHHGHVLRHAAQARHRAPERKGGGDDVDAVDAIGNAGDRNAADRVEQHEAEAREQTHHGVAEREFLFDRLDQDVEDGAVEEVEGIDDGQKPEHVIAGGRGPGGRLGLGDSLRRDIDHGSSPQAILIFGVAGAVTPRE
jgi:hypothetical protein